MKQNKIVWNLIEQNKLRMELKTIVKNGQNYNIIETAQNNISEHYEAQVKEEKNSPAAQRSLTKQVCPTIKEKRLQAFAVQSLSRTPHRK